MSIGIILRTWFYGECVGIDALGNRYYRKPGRRGWPSPKNGRECRWVMYPGEAEASSIPSEWHAWMHHTNDDIPSSRPVLKPSWGLAHRSNRTGTKEAWHRRGSALSKGQRALPRGDYRPWLPPDADADPDPGKGSKSE